MKKNDYSIIINCGKSKKKPLCYSFGNTKDIFLSVSNGKAFISFCQGVKKSPEVLLTSHDKLCSDAIKKAMMIHIICYGKPIDIRKVDFKANDEISAVLTRRKSDAPLVYSLIERPFDHLLPDTWKNRQLLQFLVGASKSSYDSRMNAVIALMVGKAMKYACEKAMYLWVSMNAFYNFFAEQYGRLTEKRITSEWEKQCILSYMTDLSVAKYKKSKRLGENEKKLLMIRSLQLLSQLDMTSDQLYNAVMHDSNDAFICKLNQLLSEYNLIILPLCFLTIWLPYQIRCNYFHGNQAVPLFLYSDEPLLKSLHFTNYFVERYLEENMPQWLLSRDFPAEYEDKLKKYDSL